MSAVDDEKRSKKDEPVPASKVLTVSEVTEYLRVHPTTIYIAAGQKLPGFRVGSEWRFSKYKALALFLIVFNLRTEFASTAA